MYGLKITAIAAVCASMVVAVPTHKNEDSCGHSSFWYGRKSVSTTIKIGATHPRIGIAESGTGTRSSNIASPRPQRTGMPDALMDGNGTTKTTRVCPHTLGPHLLVNATPLTSGGRASLLVFLMVVTPSHLTLLMDGTAPRSGTGTRAGTALLASLTTEALNAIGSTAGTMMISAASPIATKSARSTFAHVANLTRQDL
ncbi:hypothetical protein AG1IA_08167 [Rhizoctonia solani AG-1 IA]|uniref:Uncharacterized protein n=1 Tax=Thanatephorus cucumeris (strain AG1-IA) TaxID=983506 RepID=L8WN92_THACA|nr:hypothetical protein AG1IA_08167 [Rhizoctonia solani AG-1 IA]